MRVDSLKVFEVSSLSAQLLRSRTRFPLLPIPGFEIPYIGSVIGFPRRPAKEFHSSIAVLSAMVVPTAADLAYGTRFESDRIVQRDKPDTCSIENLSGCSFREPISINDFKDDIRGFNRAMVGCLANRVKTLVPLWESPPYNDNCATLAFADIPPAAK